MQILSTAIKSRILLTLTVLLLTTAAASAQNERVRFSDSRMSVGKAMEEIERQTSFVFAYNNSQFDAGQLVNLGAREMTLSQALKTMFEERGYNYVMRNRFIAINPDNVKARRANLVARSKDETSDKYTPNNINAISARDNQPPIELVEVVRTVQQVMPDAPQHNYPASYSAYEPVNRYSKLQTALPSFAIKTNILYGFAALTPNLAIEFGAGLKGTVELSGSYSWRGREKKDLDDTKQSVHSIFRAEYRWWLCERFNGHYFGAHALAGIYNVSGYKVPLLFDKEYRYDGTAFGAGVTYGYNLPLAKRWSLDFNIGVGFAYMKYDKFSCAVCDRDPVKDSKFYFGPTRAGINLVFLIK